MAKYLYILILLFSFNNVKGNPKYEEIDKLKEKTFYDDNFINWLLRVSNFGCGIRLNLVVNGAEKGNIWVDDRTNNNGQFPDPYFETTERMDFLKWYETWLDISLAKKNSG